MLKMSNALLLASALCAAFEAVMFSATSVPVWVVLASRAVLWAMCACLVGGAILRGGHYTSLVAQKMPRRK